MGFMLSISAAISWYNMDGLPACPIKVERNEFDHSNGYGEPPAKRANVSAPVPTPPPSTAAPRTQCKFCLPFLWSCSCLFFL